MRKTVKMQHALVAAAALLAAFLTTGCGGADPSAIVGSGDPAKVEAGAQDSHSSVAEGGTEPAEAGGEVDGGAGDASPSAPAFIACLVRPAAETTIAFGCGAGWSPAYTGSSEAELLAIGDYVVTVHPPNGPPVRCASWDAPQPIATVCPWEGSAADAVACDVSTPDGGLLGSSTACVYDFGASQ
jgi:hypothetical protein